MQFKTTIHTEESESVVQTDRHKPFEIKMRQTGKINSTESIIWPWAFQKALKEHLNSHGKVLYLEAGATLVLEDNPKQLIVLMQGAIKVCKHITQHKHSIHKHCILDFYLPGDSFEYTHKNDLRADIKYEVIQNSYIYISPTDFEACTTKQESEFTRLIFTKREQKIQALQDHLSVLATFNAQEKVAYFIVDMYRRLAHKKSLHLPMSRVDISLYLSLTPETVSRELNRFNHLGYLTLHRADIEFKHIDHLIKLYS